MTDVYIINSKTPEDLALELQQFIKNHKYSLSNSKRIDALLWEQEEAKANAKFPKFRPWREFLFNKTFEPNKLSNKQIENLCYEFYEEFIVSNKCLLKHYSKPPKVEIIEKITRWFAVYFKSSSRGYRQIVNNYLKSVDLEINPEQKSFLAYEPPFF